MNNQQILEKSRMAMLVGGPIFFPVLVLLISGSEHAIIKVAASWAAVAILYIVIRWRQGALSGKSTT